MGEDEPDIRLSERDLRSLAMQLALQLPRHEQDAQRVMDLMRAGYDYFLSDYVAPTPESERVVRPQFKQRRGGGSSA